MSNLDTFLSNTNHILKVWFIGKLGILDKSQHVEAKLL